MIMDIKAVGSNSLQSGPRMTEGSDMPAAVAKAPAAPVQTVNAVQQSAEVPATDRLKDAVKHINDALKALSQDLEFSVDTDSNRTIVKVVDQQTKQVIRQMPSPEALEIAKAIDRLQGLLVRQKA
jgi:flagellar protein FlaG